jgi:hypothetical protein
MEMSVKESSMGELVSPQNSIEFNKLKLDFSRSITCTEDLTQDTQQAGKGMKKSHKKASAQFQYLKRSREPHGERQ